MDVYGAIADPSRRRILELVHTGPMSVNDIARHLPQVTQPAVSKNLRILKEVGLVRSTVVKQQRIYEATPEPLREVEAWISRYTRFWNDSLDKLEALVSEENSQ